MTGMARAEDAGGFEAGWYCAFAKPRQEGFARVHLERQGMEVFFPRLRVERVARGEVVRRVEAMFPRYLFVHIGTREGLGAAGFSRGVMNLVSFGGLPTRVPGEVVEALRARCVDGVAEAGVREFMPGDAVRVVGGPCAGMEAVFERGKPGVSRVVLLLELMASVARVDVDRRHVIAASCPSG